MTYAIVIEIADDDPRVVVFQSKVEAQDFRDLYEKSTDGKWDSDPYWHHYPREPIEALPPAEALSLLRAEVEQ